MRGVPLPLEKIEQALLRCRGNITAAAAALKTARKTIHLRINQSPRLQAVLEDCREARLDNAESALDKAVDAGEGWATCFLLKTLGKSRGYVERQEVEHQGGLRVEVVEELADGDAGDSAAVPPAPGPAGVPPE